MPTDYGIGSILGVCLCAAAQICSSWENSSLVQRKLSINGDNDNKMSTHIHSHLRALCLSVCTGSPTETQEQQAAFTFYCMVFVVCIDFKQMQTIQVDYLAQKANTSLY